MEGAMSVSICKLARWADLVVVGQYEWEGAVERHPLSLAEAVAVDCGRPVLVVPAAIRDGRLRRALVAWDGSREAVRALHDALPLLREAKATVEVAMIDGEVSAVLEPLFDHLRRHQIGVEDEVHLHASGSTAGALVERLKQGHFDLLIMGAFGHPVWIEFLFGGTTPSALFNASTPVLISH
jgi:nucleotide-binding universal stress UspA family protein